MARLIGARLLGLIPTLFVVSVLTFALLHLVPGNPAITILGSNATGARIAALDHQLGLDRPLLAQYWTWLTNALHGNLGHSIFSGQSVISDVYERLGPTISLAAVGMVFALIEGVGLGVVTTLWPSGRLLRITEVWTAIGLSIPGFWLAILLVVPLALWTHLFPATGFTPLTASPIGWLHSIALGAFVLSLHPAAAFARHTRAALNRSMRQPFIMAARARGLSERQALMKHGLKNASIPLVTVVGHHFATLLGGAAFVEAIFGLNGIGQLAVASVQTQDMPIVQGIVVLTSLLVIGTNLVIDILYGVLDPRIRLT